MAARVPELLPPAPGPRPGPIPLRRARAAIPLVLGAVAAALLPSLAASPPSDGALRGLLLLSALGAAFVHRADRRSPLDAWQRAFPGLPLRGVRRLPVRPAARGRLAGAFAVLQEARIEARAWPADREHRARRRAMLREIDAGAAGLADLLTRIERIESLEHPGEALLERRAAWLDRVERQEAAGRRLLGTLRRVEPTLAPAPAPLASLLTLERDLSARLDCEAELQALEDDR